MIIGIIGCGNMGGGMATHLSASGQKVLCFDAQQGARDRMQKAGIDVASSAQSLTQQCDVIILSLPNAAIITALMSDIEGAVRQGAVVLDTSTSEPEVTKKQAANAAANGFDYVDAPVSGGPAAACSGNMTMLIGGSASAINKIYSILEILAAKIVKVGPSGAGHAAKIANNMLCAANLILVAEAVRLGKSVGVSAVDLLEGVNAGSGRSGVSEVNFPKWVLSDTFDSGFTMGLMRKDVRLALDMAKQTGVSMKAFDAVADIWLNSDDQIADSADFNEITKLENGADK